MKTKIFAIALAILASVSCTSLIEEFQPVFTGRYPDVPEEDYYELTPTHTIAQLAQMYSLGKGSLIPTVKGRDVIIAGRVSSSDKEGNAYKSLYIEDNTGGMEIKIGKTALYNSYRPGQLLYVRCTGLYIGMYGYKERNTQYNKYGNGMIQVGAEDPSGTYETSYIEETRLIDEHIFKGAPADPLVPEVVTDHNKLPDWNDTQITNKYVGKYVTLKNLTYDNEIFALFYRDPNKNTKESSNRIFLSEDTFGITSWALSENKFKTVLDSGQWDDVKVGNGNDLNYGTVADHKEEIRKNATAISVSQYFKMNGSKPVLIRTSGFSKFGDYEIPEDILNGSRSIDVTGIVTLYQGSVQFVINSYDDIRYSDTGKTLPRQ